MNCGGTTEPFVRLIICLLNERKVFLGSTISGVDIEISLSIPIPDFYV